jgi:hypothetical protein
VTAAEPCCDAGHCEYAVEAIAALRRLRDWCVAVEQDPLEAAYTFVAAASGSRAILGGRAATLGGETPQIRWADRLSELARAEAAGHQSDQEISAFLCPYAGIVEAFDEDRQGRPPRARQGAAAHEGTAYHS